MCTFNVSGFNFSRKNAKTRKNIINTEYGIITPFVPFWVNSDGLELVYPSAGKPFELRTLIFIIGTFTSTNLRHCRSWRKKRKQVETILNLSQML